ncbi:MAG: MCE family protein [Crocinitomicaceae bacterium]|nr:MCE family protein [Crocinitomicaceae bacterium]
MQICNMVVSKEYKTGILVLIGGILFFIGINYLKTTFSFGDKREFYALFDNANGLEAENEVQLNGIKVGEVLEVGLHPLDPKLVLVKFSFEKDEIEIPKTSRAWLISDLLGTKSIDIQIDYSDTASAEFYKNGDTLNARHEITLEEELNKQIGPLKEKTEKLIGSIETIIVNVKSFWDTSGAYTFDESVYHAREAIGTYQQLAQNLTKIIAADSYLITHITNHVNDVKDSVMNRKTNFDQIANEITSINTDISSTGLLTEIANLEIIMSDMNALLVSVQQGQGTMGEFVYTPEFKDAVAESKIAADNLINELTANPSKFIGISLLGKKVQGLQLTPEEEKALHIWLSQP